MRLNSRMITIYKKSLNRYPEDGAHKIVTEYFKTHEGRYGFHASQLAKMHGIPKSVAIRASAMLNDWLDQLDEMKSRLAPQVWKRLYWCARSYGTCAKFVRTCEHKLCPWCRAIQVMKLEGYLASSQVRGFTQTFIPVVEPLRPPRTPQNAVLSLRRVGFPGKVPTLQVVYFYRFSPTRDLMPVTSHVVQDVIGYDFRVTHPDYQETWLRLTRHLDPWTREIVKHRYKK